VDKEWLTCEDIAALEGISVRAVQTRCSKGQLPCVKRGKSWLINRTKYEQIKGISEAGTTGALKNILAFCNNKGGVGKSTSAVMIADKLSFLGHRVLLVDLDPQGNATTMAGLTAHEGPGRPGRGEYKYALHDVMKGKIDEIFNQKPDVTIKDAIYPARTFYVLPCDTRSERIKYWLLDWCYKFETVKKIYEVWTENFPFLLMNSVKGLEKEYDYIIIDTPPEMGWATENALMIATDVVIPIELGRLEITGLDRVFNFISNCSERNPLLSILGIIISRYGPHPSRLDVDIEHELRAHPVWGQYLFKTIVYRTLLIREATIQAESVFDYWRKGLSQKSLQSIEEFSDELIIKLNNSYQRRLQLGGYSEKGVAAAKED